MNKKQAHSFVDRWKAVREIEVRELRALTVSQRYQQLVELFEAARRFPEHPAVRARREKAIEEVRARWNKLKGKI